MTTSCKSSDNYFYIIHHDIDAQHNNVQQELEESYTLDSQANEGMDFGF